MNRYLISLLSVCVLAGCRNASEAGLVSSWFSAVSPKDVAYVEFAGPFVSLPTEPGDDTSAYGNPYRESDPVKIRVILEALRHAHPADGAPLGLASVGLPDTVTVYFKPQLHRGQQGFDIHGERVLRDFGPDVQKMYESYRRRTARDLMGR